MLSIIICSLTPSISNELKQNIESTIGVPYEIVCINNQQNQYSIFEAYNIGATQANMPYLCFMHGDILHRTNNWGKIIIEKLKDIKTGVIGVAGSTCALAIPSPWWISDMNFWKQYLSQNILQHFRSGIQYLQNNINNTENFLWNKVLVTDGVFMCCKKEVWQKHNFDSTNFKGFHFYDVDFSLSIHKAGFENYVSHEILIEHFSAGALNEKWIESSLVFQKKWKNFLPISLDEIEKNEIDRLTNSAIKNFFSVLSFNTKQNYFLWLKYYLLVWKTNPFNIKSNLWLLKMAKLFLFK